MHKLKNNLLQVGIKTVGAELCSVSSVKNNTEFIWQADPEVWGSHAPNLFPIIGCMKNGSYIFNNNTYKMTKHGFVRHNKDFKVKHESKNQISFSLPYDGRLYSMYPFRFTFEIEFSLEENKLTINHIIKNNDDKTMYFSLGGHPAFNCPLYENENYTDYVLEFENSENSPSYLLNTDNGLLTDETKSIFTNENQIQLQPDLFNEDALIFKDLNSRKVKLKHKSKGDILTMHFEDFNYLGIWAKPNAPYVCIEPWNGITDHENTNQKIEEKEGILSLEPKKPYRAQYTIEIDKRHLE